MLRINPDSWHYRLMRFGKGTYYLPPRDLCRYMRAVLLGLVLFLLVSIMVLSLSGCILLFHYYAGYWLLNGSEPFPDASAVLAVAISTGGSITVLVLAGTLCWAYQEYLLPRLRRLRLPRRGIREVKAPGLIRTWLRSRKDKVCLPIEYE